MTCFYRIIRSDRSVTSTSAAILATCTLRQDRSGGLLCRPHASKLVGADLSRFSAISKYKSRLKLLENKRVHVARAESCWVTK